VIYEIIVDAGETANKCTILPLAARNDFRLFRVHGEGPLGPLTAPLLLHHEGQCLSELRGGGISTVASVDCVWRRLPRLLARIEWSQPPRLVKIPDGFKTAYPRVGSAKTDPTGGLATIEALFIAAALLGNYDPTLLAKYYFAHRFLEINTERFLELSVNEVTRPNQLPEPFRARDSNTRRHFRGRAGKEFL